ncbi:hypothetical protein Pcryo_0941 [Psychrobacter cryohalolentis K5]|uniref:Uncharacterized protein n=3 Tax=Psychrobacter cryohalolentis TaxID=330922 RepID=Q1QC81_PSYCK|nr:hypothetical protein Pcryo_0941 [Psychrobacter cryohalolentis K5]ASE27336.1 hypothetical protein CEP87_12355 [Psychrobacter cryohalolentis]
MEILRLFESDDRMNKFQNLFKQLIYVLSEENIKYVIIGTVAYSEYAPPRATNNINFMISESDCCKLESVLKEHGIDFIWNAYQQLIIAVKDDSDETKKYPLELSFQRAPKGLTVNRPIPKEIFGVADVPVASPEVLVALWCLAVINGNPKSYYDAQMVIKLQLADVDRCAAVIDSLLESDANKVLRSILTGNAMYVDTINMGEALILPSDLIQTHEEIELVKAHRYNAVQERRRQLCKAIQQTK